MISVFDSENLAFKDKKHMIIGNYGNAMTTNLNFLSLIYSVPTKLFTNGRTSIEIGGLLGTIHGNLIVVK